MTKYKFREEFPKIYIKTPLDTIRIRGMIFPKVELT